MSAATPCTENSTSSTSKSPRPTEASGTRGDADGGSFAPARIDPRSAALVADDTQPALPAAQARARLAWCVTGSGHFLEESLAIAARLPAVDLFLSAAAEEVLPIYKLQIETLKAHFRVFRDKTASGVPVGMLYDDVYHTVVVAPATSNTVAKCAFGMSDSLPTNMFAQAGKLGIPGIVFACDTEPVVVTKSPHDWVTLRPRRIELDNVERLRGIDFCQVVTTPAELEAALDARLKDLSLAWNTSSS
jgi:dihydromethanopterin reductase (acceptor)